MNNNIIKPRYIDLLSEHQKYGANKFIIRPSESNGSIPISIDFIYDSRRYKYDILIPEKYYQGAKSANHIFAYDKVLISEEEATQVYYESMILERSQELFYQKLLSVFYDIKLQENLTTDEYLELMITYVQSLPYDNQKAAQSNIKINFPIETAVEGKGVCSDKSVLLAGLLTCSGYAVSLLEFNNENHMMVGIPVEKDYSNMQSGYIFLETTLPRIMGIMPEFSGEIGKKIQSFPNIIQIGYGKLKYNRVRDINIIYKVKDYLDRFFTSNQVKSNIIQSFWQKQHIDVKNYNELVTLYNKIQSGTYSVGEISKEIKSCHTLILKN